MSESTRKCARGTDSAIEAHYRLILWLVRTLGCLPRSQNFLLCNQIQEIAIDILETLIEVTCTKHTDGLLFAVQFRNRKTVFPVTDFSRPQKSGFVPP